MLRNITLSADETLIQKARERAKSQNVSLNVLFRQWLERYAGAQSRPATYHDLMASLETVEPGHTFSRDELNER